MFKVDYMV